MVIAPEVTDSSPASMRSEVDFPHPDGPTRTVKDPSGSSKFRSLTTGFDPYDLLTPEKRTVAMKCESPTLSELHRAAADALHQPALDEKACDHDGYDGDEDRRAHRADLHTAECVEPGDRDRKDRRFARREDESVEQVVPRQREAEDRRGSDTWEDLGEYHQPERCEARETVDLCLFLQRARHRFEKADQKPGNHRQNETQVRKDDRYQSVVEPQRVGHGQERKHQDRRRQYLRRQHPEPGGGTAGAVAGDRVGTHAPDHHTDAHGDDRDDGAASRRSENARRQHVAPAVERGSERE